jgi:hypothetical protein
MRFFMCDVALVRSRAEVPHAMMIRHARWIWDFDY